MAKKVYVGISGGVDSSVAALLLKKEGYDVTGFTFKIEEKEDLSGAAAACGKLGIAHEVVDVRKLFEEKVSGPFLDIYQQGRTPNPCVLCNKYIKFGAMLDYIKDKADFIATGHYSTVVYSEETGRYTFKKSADSAKDQTYMFYTLTQDQIKKIIMPLGKYKKSEIREIAKENGFDSADRKDSQDICFLKGMSLEEYIRKNRPSILNPGDITDVEGNVLGKHNGICGYTIGQRRGLGVSSDGKIYVVGLSTEENRVVLGKNELLFSDSLFAENVNFLTVDRVTEPMEVEAKIRYAAKPAKAIITPHEKGVFVKFHEPQRAITPGQSVVFYDGDLLVGGGEIAAKEKI